MTTDAPKVEQVEAVADLRARSASTRMVPIQPSDRRELARALVLQGYDALKAHRMAYDETGDVQDNDGALQMLARHRLAALAGEDERVRVAVEAERERCAKLADAAADEAARIGCLHPEDSPSWDRMFARSREVRKLAIEIRRGEA